MPRGFFPNLNIKFSGDPSGKELAAFAGELGFLIAAGLPLIRCLSIIEKQKTLPRIRRLAPGIREKISSGSSFSCALRSCSFPEIFISIVEAGERGGTLEEGLKKIARHFEAKEALRGKIIASMIYPAIVLSLSFAAVIFLAVYVMPLMGGVFAELDVELPLFVRMVFSFGAFVSRYFFIILLALLVAGLVLRALARRFNESFFPRMLLNIPVLGDAFKNLILSRIVGTLASLTSSGVPLTASLSAASAASANPIYRGALKRVGADVLNGRTLSQSFSATALFPESFCEMVHVAESSGNLAPILEQMSSRYELAAESRFKALATFVEPMATVLCGAAVSAIVFSIFIPLFQVVEAIAK